MIDYNDLINRIESMQDLPVSEEMLGAYCEGTLSPIDAASMDNYIANDAEIGELVDSVDNSQGSDNLYTFGYGKDGVDDIDLPNVPMGSAINPFDIGIAPNIDDFGIVAAATAVPPASLEQQTIETLMDTTEQIPDIQQQYPDTCAIKSQQIILNEFGIDVTEDQLVQFSYEQGWYNGDGSGTSAQDVGNLLESANIPVTRQDGANVFNLVSELSQGHKVIVGVDSGELWGDKFTAWIKDFFMGDTPDHALVVAGIDTSDPNNVMVIVDDPGSGEYHKAYPLDQFMDAWSDAECYMVSTDVPIPEFAPTMANFDYGQGHLAIVGGMDYADFQIFNDLSYGLPVNTIVDGMNVYPTSSLMDAYFDVAHNKLAFNDIFTDNYMFNDYMDTDIATQMMQQTYQDNLSLINFNELPNNPDISTVMTNQDYESYLHGSIDYFNSVGDFDSAMLCQQQLMMVDYCDNYDIDFCSTFLG